MKKKKISILILPAILSSLLNASAIHVSTAGNDATGDGSISYPYATIDSAIAVSLSGDSIKVSGGTYIQNVTINGKSITVLGGYSQDFTERDLTVYETIIDRPSDGYSHHTVELDNATVTFDGFTIKNTTGSTSEDYGFAIYNASNSTVSHNRITDCYSDGINIYSNSTNINISNNLIAHNGESSSRYGIRINAPNALIVNNTFYDNKTHAISINTGSAPSVIKNNIFMKNGTGIFEVSSTSSPDSIIYNDFYSNTTVILQFTNHILAEQLMLTGLMLKRIGVIT